MLHLKSNALPDCNDVKNHLQLSNFLFCKGRIVRIQMELSEELSLPFPRTESPSPFLIDGFYELFNVKEPSIRIIWASQCDTDRVNIDVNWLVLSLFFNPCVFDDILVICKEDRSIVAGSVYQQNHFLFCISRVEYGRTELVKPDKRREEIATRGLRN